jgi:hypothetical protein
MCKQFQVGTFQYDSITSPTTHLAVGIVTNVRVHDGKGNRLEDDQYEKTERGDEVAQNAVMAHAPKDKNPDPDQPRQHECRRAHGRVGLATVSVSLFLLFGMMVMVEDNESENSMSSNQEMRKAIMEASSLT